MYAYQNNIMSINTTTTTRYSRFYNDLHKVITHEGFVSLSTANYGKICPRIIAEDFGILILFVVPGMHDLQLKH